MNKKIISKIGIGVGAALVALLPVLALAQAQGPVQPVTVIQRPGQISDLLQSILTWVGGIVFTISLIMLLWAAILYLTAGASETAHTKAKNVLIYAIVGIVVAILAFSAQPFIENVLRRQFF